jgi:hypothetical protein
VNDPAASTEAGAARAPLAFAWLWIVGALLASAALLLLASLPPLPARADAFGPWVDDGTFQLTWAGELLFFAVIAWGTGAAGAFGARVTDSPVRRRIALVALGVALVAFVIVLLALGRLVYPVADVDLADDTTVLLASVVVGTVHLALLALAVVAVTLPAKARAPRTRRTLAAAGVTSGVLFAVGSYPWLLPTWLNVTVAVVVGCWGVLVGVAVLSADRRARP